MAILLWLYEQAMCCFYPLGQRKHCHALFDVAWKQNTLGVPFKQWKEHATNRALRERGSPLVYLPYYRRYLGGKKKVFIYWDKTHWGWCSFTYLIILLNQDACEVCVKAVLLWLYELGMCCYRFLMQNHTSLLWRTGLEWILIDGKSLECVRVQRIRGSM